MRYFIFNSHEVLFLIIKQYIFSKSKNLLVVIRKLFKKRTIKQIKGFHLTLEKSF